MMATAKSGVRKGLARKRRRTKFDILVGAIQRAIGTSPDITFNGALTTHPKWSRVPYTAEVSRLWGDPRIYGLAKSIGYTVRLTEYGRKPKAIEFLGSDPQFAERIIHAISRHMHGPRDLS